MTEEVWTCIWRGNAVDRSFTLRVDDLDDLGMQERALVQLPSSFLCSACSRPPVRSASRLKPSCCN